MSRNSSEKPRIRISSLDQLLGCPGSRRFVDALGIRRTDRGESWEGTWCHHRVASRLIEECGAVYIDGELPPHGLPETFHPGAWAEWKARWAMRQILDEAGADRAIVVEEPIQWEFDRFILTGHPDVTTFTFDAREIGIDDEKYGSNIVDAAECNWQLTGYAAIRKLQFPQARRIKTRILQPSAPEDLCVTSFTFEGDVLDKLPAALEILINRALDNDDILRTGHKHCRWCPAFLVCPAIMAEIKLTRELLAKLPADDGEIKLEHLAKLAVAAKLLNKPLESAKDLLKERLLQSETRELVLEDGTKLFIKDAPGTREVDAERAWPRIVEQIPEHAYKCITVSAEAVEKSLSAALKIPHKSEVEGTIDAREEFRRRFGDVTTRKPQKHLIIA